MAASAIYERTHLPTGAMRIRLLELQPQTRAHPLGPDESQSSVNGDADMAPLRCRIFSTPIDGAPFQALSYAWGSGQQTHRLSVTTSVQETDDDGELHVLPITASLDNALRHLRHPTETLVLWVDQICIDQSNVEEKTHQVALMTQIYTQAWQVLVWLGPATPASVRLMDIWRSVGQEARDWGLESYYTVERYPLLKRIESETPPEDLMELATSFEELCRRTALRFLGKTNFSEPDDLSIFESLTDWYRRSWFSRVWVMQEFALSRKPIFICGHKRVEARLVLLAKQILERSRTIALILYRDSESMQVSAPSETIAAFDRVYYDTTQPFFTAATRRRRMNGEDGPGDTLLQLLMRMYANRNEQEFLAGDPRDRIYGLLGLAIDSETLGIFPDYSRDITADLIYTRVMRAIIRQHSRAPDDGYALDILGLVHHPKGGPRDVVDALPSWSADWFQPQPSFCARLVSSIKQPVFFKASGEGKDAHMLATTADCILGLVGFLVDEVVEVGTPWLGAPSEDSEVHRALLEDVKRMCNISNEKLELNETDDHDSSQRRAEAVWRVPIGDIEQIEAESLRATDRSRIAHRILLENISPLDLPKLKQSDQQDLDGSFKRGDPNRYTMRMDEMRNKRPFVTKNQGFIGMGPLGMEAGDVVVIFRGAQVPHVLRLQEEARTFSFLGEAYCHGIMDGEILTQDYKSEAFYLR